MQLLITRIALEGWMSALILNWRAGGGGVGGVRALPSVQCKTNRCRMQANAHGLPRNIRRATLHPLLNTPPSAPTSFSSGAMIDP